MSLRLLTLSNGRKMPQLGLGTWKSKPDEVGNAVKSAIDIGYRHFDTAYAYFNEKEIGDALKEVLSDGKVKREELFIVTKLLYLSPESVRKNFMESYKKLQLDYIDLYLIHTPIPLQADETGGLKKDETGAYVTDDIDYLDTYKEMEKLVDDGLVKSIGVSNFNHKQLERILGVAKHKPVTNQIEVHPYFTRTKLINWCLERNIITTCYSPFASLDRPWAKDDDPNLLKDQVVKSIASKHNKTPAQVLLRFCIDLGCAVIPKSVNPGRMKENFEIFNFKLTPEEVTSIQSLNRNWMMSVDAFWHPARNHPFYPFNEF
ncbi:aldo-keto reductase family 1 member B1-like [Saccoglossus kowalevskii]|uniref:Aldose reductase-like n=1 Tax=Saccoglossus kowalevskii TaxID=10224 RepID=A0ABM0MSR9_SACKO|nr:PREDICTED: aldose reductase-like [Saccoglossus kowalevskii]